MTRTMFAITVSLGALAGALAAIGGCSGGDDGAGTVATTTGAGTGGSAGTGGAGAEGGAGATGGAPAGGAGGSGGGASARLWGITIDDLWTERPAIVDAIDSLAQPMTTRIVFDEGVSAAEYDASVREIAAVTAVQGLLVDSFYAADYSVDEYVARAEEYLAALGDVVAIWEVGNEANGEWLGAATDVAQKIHGAYLAVEEAGGTTALTLYYNGLYDNGQPTENNCWEQPDNQMQRWAEANVPADMKAGLDYVWVSYYEDDCDGIAPDWPAVFEDLAAMFPNALLGIGECGTVDASSKAATIERYYRDLLVDHPRYVGGYFWWYGKQDFVPKTNPLWQVLQDAMNARER